MAATKKAAPEPLATVCPEAHALHRALVAGGAWPEDAVRLMAGAWLALFAQRGGWQRVQDDPLDLPEDRAILHLLGAGVAPADLPTVEE